MGEIYGKNTFGTSTAEKGAGTVALYSNSRICSLIHFYEEYYEISIFNRAVKSSIKKIN